MTKNKYQHILSYSVDRKTIELAKVLNSENKNLEVIKSKELVPEKVAWVLIYWLRGNDLKEIKTKFGTLTFKGEKINESIGNS